MASLGCKELIQATFRQTAVAGEGLKVSSVFVVQMTIMIVHEVTFHQVAH